MEILIADINLVNDASYKGEKLEGNETLADFINYDEGALTLADINKDLVACGIEPITLDQLVITGVKGQ